MEPLEGYPKVVLTQEQYTNLHSSIIDLLLSSKLSTEPIRIK